eukprot:scaffold237_cov421-Prasinococcus_capsulatus_cf.AAC.3
MSLGLGTTLLHRTQVVTTFALTLQTESAIATCNASPPDRHLDAALTSKGRGLPLQILYLESRLLPGLCFGSSTVHESCQLKAAFEHPSVFACADYTAICVDAPDTPSSEANGGSCENNCGLLAESDDDFCYCDEFCTTNGDCCSDYTLECADSFPDASCDTLCGSSTEEGCWCEETCTEYGDCWWELLPHHHALDKRLLTSIVCFVCPYTVSITRPSVLFQTLRKIPVRRMIRSAACVAVLQSQESVSVTSTVLGTYVATQPRRLRTCAFVQLDCCADYTLNCGGVPVPDDPTGTEEGSCDGNCGSAFVNNDGGFFTCFCDQYCTTNFDCCDDYTQLCDQENVPAQYSCQPSDCGKCVTGTEIATGSEVFCCCQEGCSTLGNCCQDVDICPSESTPVDCTDAVTCPKSVEFDDSCDCYYFDASFADLVSSSQVASLLEEPCDGTTGVAKSMFFSLPDVTPGTAYNVLACPVQDPSAASYQVSVAALQKSAGIGYDYDVGLCDIDDGVFFFFDYFCSEETNGFTFIPEGETMVTVTVYGLSSDTVLTDDDGYFTLAIWHVPGYSKDDPIAIDDLPFLSTGYIDVYGDQFSPPPSSECLEEGVSTGNDIWFSFAPEETVQITLSTCEQEDDDNTVQANIHILTDPSTEEACASAARIIPGCAKGSEIDFTFEADVTYYIVVDTYAGSDLITGEYRFLATHKLGDSSKNPFPIASLPFDDPDGSTKNMTDAFSPALFVGAGCDAPDSNAPDAFYVIDTSIPAIAELDEWIDREDSDGNSMETLSVFVTLCSEATNFDTAVFIVEASEFQAGSGSLQACNVDAYRSGCSLGSEVAAALERDTVYYVIVDGEGAFGGEYRLSVKLVDCDTKEEADQNVKCHIPYQLPFSIEDTTIGHTHTVDPPSKCAAANGADNTNVDSPDVIYLFSPPNDMSVALTICPTSQFECVVYIQHCSPEGCDDIQSAEALCTEEAERDGCGLGAQGMKLDAQGGHTYYVIVDGVSVDENSNVVVGEYRLYVDLAKTGSISTGGLGDGGFVFNIGGDDDDVEPSAPDDHNTEVSDSGVSVGLVVIIVGAVAAAAGVLGFVLWKARRSGRWKVNRASAHLPMENEFAVMTEG